MHRQYSPQNDILSIPDMITTDSIGSVWYAWLVVESVGRSLRLRTAHFILVVLLKYLPRLLKFQESPLAHPLLASGFTVRAMPIENVA